MVKRLSKEMRQAYFRLEARKNRYFKIVQMCENEIKAREREIFNLNQIRSQAQRHMDNHGLLLQESEPVIEWVLWGK